MKHASPSKPIAVSIACLLLAVAAPALTAQVISLNFNENAGNQNLDGQTGLGPLGTGNWNDTKNFATGGLATGTMTGLVDDAGAATGVSVSWSSSGTWFSATGTDTPNDQIMVGYLDDGASGVNATFTNVPFLTYDVYGLVASDQNSGNGNTFLPFDVNGFVTPQFDGIGNFSANGDVFAEGVNYWVAPASGDTLVVQGTPRSGASRGSLAALQIQNTYSNPVSYWDLSGDTAGSGGPSPSGTWDSSSNNWSDSPSGDAATTTFTGGNAAAFSAGDDATGTYTISVDGVQSPDVLWVQNGNVTFTGGEIQLGASGLINVNTGATAVINSTISGTNGLTKASAGSATLAGTNTFSGGATFSGGTTTLQGGNAIPDSESVGIGGGATVVLDTSETIGTLGGSGTIELDSNTLTTNADSDSAFSGTVNGTGELIKSGTGALTLGGTMNVDTRVSGGTLKQGSTTVFGNTTVTVEDGATLDVNGNGQSGATHGITITGDGVGGNGALYNSGGSAQGGSGIQGLTLSGDSSIGVAEGSRLDIAPGAVVDGGDFSLVKKGLGEVWWQAGAETTLGAVVVQEGLLGMQSPTNNDNLGDDTTTITVEFGATLGFWGGNTLTKPLVANGGNIDSRNGETILDGNITLNSDSNLGGGSNMIVNGGISGDGSLIKFGGGTTTLTGTNTYSGDTIVQAGTLIIASTSNLPGTDIFVDGGTLNVDALGELTIAPGQRLGGGGSITTDIRVGPGAIVSPGNSPGTLNTAGVIWEDGGVLEFEVADFLGTAGTDWDLLAIDGILNLGNITAGGIDLELHSLQILPETMEFISSDAANFDENGTYELTIASTTGGVIGFAAGKFAIDGTDFTNANEGVWGVALNGNDIVLTYAIPEPATYAALFGGIVLALAFFRRRRN